MATFEERYAYLMLKGSVGEATFGAERFLNQGFYKSSEWRQVRHRVIVRDNGCDLGIDGYDIFSGLLIHHMNPMTLEDVKNGHPSILDPDNLITTTLRTHNHIHYGDDALLAQPFTDRRPGDTKLW